MHQKQILSLKQKRKIDKQNLCQNLIIIDCVRQKRHVLSVMDILSKKLAEYKALIFSKKF